MTKNKLINNYKKMKSNKFKAWKNKFKTNKNNKINKFKAREKINSKQK